MRFCVRAALIAGWIGCAIGFAASGEGPQLLTSEAGATIPVHGLVDLEIEGVLGEVVLKAGKAGELRYMSAEPEDHAKGRPLALWREGRTLRLRPLAGSEERPRILEIAVPPEVELVLADLHDTRLSATGLQGGFHVRGQRLDLQCRGLAGAAQIEIYEGKIDIDRVRFSASITGESLDIALKRVEGPVYLSLGASLALVAELSLGLEAEIDDTELVATAVRGAVRVTGNGGSVGILRAESGGELNLTGTLLDLRESKGQFRVETNATARFGEHSGGLTIRGDEASIVGNGIRDTLTVESKGGEVRLENVSGPTTIGGDDVTVHVTGSTAALTVTTVGSDITIARATAPVVVTSEFGDVEVRGASERIELKSSNGDVRLAELRGPVQIHAAGAEVQVSWAALPDKLDSLVENQGGDVRVHFPAEGGAHVSAEAPNGRIESLLDAIVVAEGGTTAAGDLNRANRPVIRIRASGDVFVTGAAAEQP